MEESFSSSEGAHEDHSSHLEPCPECQRPLSRRAHFCPSCGFPFESEPSREEAASYRNHGGLVDLCQVLATVILAVCVLTAGLVFYQSHSAGSAVVTVAGLFLVVTPIVTILWSQAVQLELLEEIRQETASRRRKPAAVDREKRRPPLHLDPEDRRAAQKLCSVLLEHAASSRQVEVKVEVELAAPQPLGSAEAKQWRDECGLQVVDTRPSYQVLVKSKVERLRGRINTSRLLDLARLPQVRAIRAD